RVTIVPEDVPIAQGGTHTYLVSVLNGETTLRACMTFLDPAGNPAAALQRINDLNLTLTSPDGTVYRGNNGLTAGNVSTSGGTADSIDTVECVLLDNPAPGTWTVTVTAPTVAVDANLATPNVDAVYALVVNGGIKLEGSGCARYIPDVSPTGSGNVIPFGGTDSSSLPTLMLSNNGGASGGAVYFDATFNQNTFWNGIDVNTGAAVGTKLIVDLYYRNGTYVGNAGSNAGWIAVTAGHGLAAGQDLPSRIFFNEPWLVTPGTYGIAVVARNFAHRYTNGTGTNQAFSNADLSLTLGAASNVPFTGTPFSPRVANVTPYYNRDDATWNNQLYQTILRREELGAAGPISNLAFSCNATVKHFNRQLRIRMSHVPAGHTLSTTFASNMPSPVTVMDKWNYTWFTAEDDWSEIGFSTPFAYNGTSDVVVEIYARGNTSTGFPVASGSISFNSGPQERVFAYGWPFSAVPTTGSYGASSGLRMRVNTNCATFTEYGTSCGPLETAFFSSPNRGSTAWYDLYGAPANGGVILAMGFGTTTFPSSLTSYGFTNCNVYHDLTVSLFKFANASGFTFHGFAVPNDPAFDGLRVHGQWFALDATQPGGITASNYITNLIGIDP
ncbi:MAG: hypothetical protein RL398_3490, partial [Planctomycetota bacterium]